MTFPWSNISLPSNRQPGLSPRWKEGKKSLLLPEHRTLKARSRSVAGKSYVICNVPIKNCSTWASVITAHPLHWSLLLHHIPCGNDCQASALTNFLLLLLESDACVAFGLCFLSVIDTFSVELKGTSGFLVHFQREANVFYNGLQKGILNQLFYQLTT